MKYIRENYLSKCCNAEVIVDEDTHSIRQTCAKCKLPCASFEIDNKKWVDLSKLKPQALFPIALAEVHKVMVEGEKKYPRNDWDERDIEEHVTHAQDHLSRFIDDYIHGDLESAKENVTHLSARVLMLTNKFLKEVESNPIEIAPKIDAKQILKQIAKDKKKAIKDAKSQFNDAFYAACEEAVITGRSYLKITNNAEGLNIEHVKGVNDEQ